MKPLLFTMMAILFVLPTPAQEPKPNGLDPYVGKDLRKLDERANEKFQKQLESLTGDKPEKKQWNSYQPWWVKPFVQGKAGWLLLEAYPGYDIPDVSAVQIHVFDKNWKRLAGQSFPTGYRFFLKEVALLNDNPLQQPLLVAQVTSSGPFIVQGKEKHPAFEQGDSQFQYYALSGDHFVMVRLEDNKKNLAQNHYRWEIPPKGPPLPTRTRDQWIASLSSAGPVEQLATLVWLSGTHLRSTDARPPNNNQEGIEDSKLFESVRDAATTKKALRQLTDSKNSWVQEYARFTLQLTDK